MSVEKVIDLDAIRALESAAAPGPWTHSVYEILRFEPWGANIIAKVGPYAGDTPDDTLRFNTAEFIAAARTAVPDLLVLLDEALAQVNRLAFLIDQPSDGWIEWAERYRGGDSSLSSEAFYILRDTSNVWVNEAHQFLARFSPPSPTDEEKT